MADITNRTAIAFCNERIRPAADDLAQAYNWAKDVVNFWNANNIAALIPNNAADEIKDGADVDGRQVIFGDDVHNMINRLTELITDYELLANAKLNTILQVSVNSSTQRGNRLL